MSTRKVTALDGAAAIAMLDRERKTTGYVTEMRRCSGSERFGIEPHEAPVSTFPKQPSRKDGLGTMCSEHWKVYVKGLAAARKAAGPAKPSATTDAAKRKTAKPKLAKPSANAAKVAEAEQLIAEVDALPADQHVGRVGQADVQSALETTAAARMLAD